MTSKIPRSLLPFMLFFCAFTAWAQEAFIEVVITDTLILEPTTIVYRVESGSTTTFMGIPIPSNDEDPDALQQDLNTVYLLLKKNKFLVEYDERIDYTIGKDMMKGKTKPQGKALLVTVHNEADLRRCVDLVSGMQGLTGTVAEVRHASPDAQLPAFHARVIARARTEATAIAQASQLELGPVIAVQERQHAGTDNYMELMQQMMKRGMDAFNSTEQVRKSVVKTMVVRFIAR